MFARIGMMRALDTGKPDPMLGPRCKRGGEVQDRSLIGFIARIDPAAISHFTQPDLPSGSGIDRETAGLFVFAQRGSPRSSRIR